MNEWDEWMNEWDEWEYWSSIEQHSWHFRGMDWDRFVRY